MQTVETVKYIIMMTVNRLIQDVSFTYKMEMFFAVT